MQNLENFAEEEEVEEEWESHEQHTETMDRLAKDQESIGREYTAVNWPLT